MATNYLILNLESLYIVESMQKPILLSWLFSIVIHISDPCCLNFSSSTSFYNEVWGKLVTDEEAFDQGCSGGQTTVSAVHLHLKEKNHSFEDNNFNIVAREDGWF